MSSHESKPEDPSQPTTKLYVVPPTVEANLKNVDISLGNIQRNLALIKELDDLLQAISSLGTEKELQTATANTITFCWLTLREVTSILRLITLYQDWERLNLSSSYLAKLVGYLTRFTSYMGEGTISTKS